MQSTMSAFLRKTKAASVPQPRPDPVSAPSAEAQRRESLVKQADSRQLPASAVPGTAGTTASSAAQAAGRGPGPHSCAPASSAGPEVQRRSAAAQQVPTPGQGQPRRPAAGTGSCRPEGGSHKGGIQKGGKRPPVSAPSGFAERLAEAAQQPAAQQGSQAAAELAQGGAGQHSFPGCGWLPAAEQLLDGAAGLASGPQLRAGPESSDDSKLLQDAEWLRKPAGELLREAGEISRLLTRPDTLFSCVALLLSHSQLER